MVSSHIWAQVRGFQLGYMKHRVDLRLSRQTKAIRYCPDLANHRVRPVELERELMVGSPCNRGLHIRL
jgi:hypothetical protein